MIQITRPAIPQILATNQERWTQELENLIQRYGSYAAIPEKEKGAAIKHYAYEEIKREVKNMSHGKCVFCEFHIEPVTYSEIEHFHPKSLYPAETFSWENLFLACRHCNSSKGDRDTRREPIVNPETENPELFFTYDKALRLDVHPDSPDAAKSQRTIEACNLQRWHFISPRAAIATQFAYSERDIKEKVKEYIELSQLAARKRKLEKIYAALEFIKSLSAKHNAYAGYLRHLLRTSPVIEQAINLINDNLSLLNLSQPFTLY